MGSEFDPEREVSDREGDEAQVDDRAPGWYDDPLIEGQQRNWDGTQWTNEVRKATASTSPESEHSSVPAGPQPTSSGTLPPAGWYPDNQDPTKQRWWNGSNWTNQVHGQTPALTPRTQYCTASRN